MANAKRQRQDEARELKRQAEEAAAKKTAQRRRVQRIGIIGGAAVAAVVILTLLTRGGSDSGDSASAPSTTGQPTVVTASPQLKTKPVVTVPAGDPPKALQITDLVKGTGDTVVQGDTVSVQYTGVSWSTKEQFDSSWDSGGTPYEVTGVGTDLAPVIKGWSQGLLGAKVGSRRQLVIPPDLGYGKDGAAGGAIKPDETLVFVVDIVSTTHVGATAGATTTSVG